MGELSYPFNETQCNSYDGYFLSNYKLADICVIELVFLILSLWGYTGLRAKGLFLKRTEYHRYVCPYLKSDGLSCFWALFGFGVGNCVKRWGADSELFSEDGAFFRGQKGSEIFN